MSKNKSTLVIKRTAPIPKIEIQYNLIKIKNTQAQSIIKHLAKIYCIKHRILSLYLLGQMFFLYKSFNFSFIVILDIYISCIFCKKFLLLLQIYNYTFYYNTKKNT